MQLKYLFDFLADVRIFFFTYADALASILQVCGLFLRLPGVFTQRLWRATLIASAGKDI